MRRITVGTALDNDLRLEEATVSRRHAAIERRWGRWRVADLGSTNGTYVNGRRVKGSCPLERGDEVRFGNARFGLVAPGDDLSEGGSAKRKKPPRRPISRTALAVAVALFFLGAFGLTEYLLNFNRLDKAADLDGGGGAATTRAGSSSTAASEDGAAPQWLARLNHYRAMVGLAPVSDDSVLSKGERDHARYLIRNYGEMIRKGINIGAAMHTEDPARPGYTPVGLRAARNSDVDERAGSGPPSSANWAIDDWMTGAFHRLNLLNPGLGTVAYGESCDKATCVAALNVLSGDERSAALSGPGRAPLRFPPPGATVDIGPLAGEWPDPLSACPGYRAPAGLPITLELGSTMAAARLASYRLVRNGRTPARLDACGFDAATYASPDPVARRRGRDILRAFGAVVVIPRSPLAKGAGYAVSMTVNGREYKWSFSTAP